MTDVYALHSKRVVVEGALREAAVLISGAPTGEIVDVVAPDEVPPGIPVEDLGDLVIMAGLIDAHVHINEPGRADWEGFETATRAACAGGITTVVDMPLNSSPVTTTVPAFEAKLAAAAGKLSVDCAFYGGLVPGNAGEMEALIQAGVVGVKAFLCHSGIDEFPNAREEDLREAMPVLAKHGVPLLVHGELLDDVDEAAALREDPRSYEAYLRSRPSRWEVQAIELLLRLCEETGCHVHVVHLATGDALEALRDARARGLPVTVETGPHYLFWAAEELPDGQTQYKCAPPIREVAHREALRRALLSGEIDLVGTDHSPAPPSIKELVSGDLSRAWGGISSLQLLLPATWTAMRGVGATPVEMARWLAEAPAKMLGLGDRGAIRPGLRADLVVWDPEATFTVDAAKLHHRHAVTPYHGDQLAGVVRSTFLAGRRVFGDGEFLVSPGGRPHRRVDGADR